MNNTDSLNESVQKGTLCRYGFDRHNTANKICTVLKYLSLTHPNLQMPELRGIFEQNFAANLLTEIILNSRWYKDSVTTEIELSFFSKDDYTYTFNKFLTLYDELSEYIKKVNVHLTIENFSSNYYGGYYGEIYDNANYTYNGEKSIVVSNIERPLESKKGELVVHLINIEFCKSQLSSSLFNRLYPLKKIKFNRSIGNDLFFFKKFVTKEKIRFDSSESSLFYLVFEYTKYIPELIQGLVNSSPDTKIDTEVMSIVLESLNHLYKLFTEEFCREELAIKIKELKNNSYMYRILPAYIVDEIAAIQNLSLPYKKVEDTNDSQ